MVNNTNTVKIIQNLPLKILSIHKWLVKCEKKKTRIKYVKPTLNFVEKYNSLLTQELI